MGLCLVTGVSGTGKSAALGALRARGCLARGVDEDGYADWVSRRTGAAEVIPRGDPGFDIHAWYQQGPGAAAGSRAAGDAHPQAAALPG